MNKTYFTLIFIVEVALVFLLCGPVLEKSIFLHNFWYGRFQVVLVPAVVSLVYRLIYNRVGPNYARISVVILLLINIIIIVEWGITLNVQWLEIIRNKTIFNLW
jgi:hypothetical protein